MIKQCKRTIPETAKRGPPALHTMRGSSKCYSTVIDLLHARVQLPCIKLNRLSRKIDVSRGRAPVSNFAQGAKALAPRGQPDFLLAGGRQLSVQLSGSRILQLARCTNRDRRGSIRLHPAKSQHRAACYLKALSSPTDHLESPVSEQGLASANASGADLSFGTDR